MCTKNPQPCLQEIVELAKKGKSNVIEIIFFNYLLAILLIRIATVGFQGDTGIPDITDTGISQHDFCMRTVTDVNSQQSSLPNLELEQLRGITPPITYRELAKIKKKTWLKSRFRCGL
jgi:hypothetical protein